MTRILDRLVASTFLRLFLLFILASPILFILGDITENLDTYIDRGLTGAEVARSYVYRLPQFIQWSFPLAALVAAVFAVHTMTTHREIMAAKAGGISFYRMILPLVVVGVLLSGVALALEEIVPRGNRIAGQILRNENPRANWRSAFVYQSEDGIAWQVERLTAADGRMTGVVLELPGEGDRPGTHVLADAAGWNAEEGWTFHRGYMRELRPDSTVRTLEFERLQVAGITEQPEELLEVPREPEEMTYEEIDRLASILERSGGNARELLVKQKARIALAVATLIVILFGAPLATSAPRGGTAHGLGLSLGATIVYLLLFKVAGGLGEAGALSPMAAAWTPNAIYAVGAAFLLARVRT